MPTVQQLYPFSPLRPAPLRSAFRLADARAGRRAPAAGPRRRAAPAHVGCGGEPLRRRPARNVELGLTLQGADADLLALARLQRRRDALVDEYGEAAVDAAWGGLVWGVYEVLGKLCPTV